MYICLRYNELSFRGLVSQERTAKKSALTWWWEVAAPPCCVAGGGGGSRHDARVVVRVLTREYTPRVGSSGLRSTCVC